MLTIAITINFVGIIKLYNIYIQPYIWGAIAINIAIIAAQLWNL